MIEREQKEIKLLEQIMGVNVKSVGNVSRIINPLGLQFGKMR